MASALSAMTIAIMNTISRSPGMRDRWADSVILCIAKGLCASGTVLDSPAPPKSYAMQQHRRGRQSMPPHLPTKKGPLQRSDPSHFRYPDDQA